MLEGPFGDGPLAIATGNRERVLFAMWITDDIGVQ
jgi:hypothetical protein